MHRRFVLGLVASMVATLVVASQGCSGEPTVTEVVCPTEPGSRGYDDPGCVELRIKCICDPSRNYPECKRARELNDGGVDCPDASMGSSPQATCIPNPPDGFESAQPFWYGPTMALPASCPSELGAFGALSYADLVAPPLTCPACVCKASEKARCPLTPSILLRSEKCDVGISGTYDLNPPASWDGSCSSAKTLSAGAACPPGSGKLCATSIYSGALPDPVDECEPDELPVLYGLDNWIRWASAALSCSPSEAAPPGQPCGEMG